MAFHTKTNKRKRCTKRKQTRCKKQQRSHSRQQQRRRRQTGGNIRAGSRFPESFYTAQTQLTDTHNACAHAKWTGEI